RRGRIGNALACDIWRGAVNRFKHRRVGLGGVDIARGCQADAACNSACQVGQDIAEEVIGDNNVVALRIGDHVNSGGVDVVVVDLDLREFLGDIFYGALPQVTSVDQHVGLVHQGQLFATALGTVESIAYHALDAVAGVLRDLRGHLVLSTLTQSTAIARIQAFGTFANYDEVNLAGISQRRNRGWVQLGRTQVHVVIQCKAQLEQQTALQDPWRNLAWRTHGT